MVELVATLEKEIFEVRKQKLVSKLYLERLELVTIKEFREENPKSRTAKDTIVAEAKINNEDWLLEEKKYLETDIKLQTLKEILTTAQGMISNHKYEKEDVENYLKTMLDYIKGEINE